VQLGQLQQRSSNAAARSGCEGAMNLRQRCCAAAGCWSSSDVRVHTASAHQKHLPEAVTVVAANAVVWLLHRPAYKPAAAHAPSTHPALPWHAENARRCACSAHARLQHI
jgi:hypothetical protein